MLSQLPKVVSDTEPMRGEKLSSAVEAHIRRYFDQHGESLPPPGLYNRILKEVELPLIALTLSATRGNQIKAAELLGLNRNTLRKKIGMLDIQVTRTKKLM
jgi:two-component system nitrogen regulation response regulator GlnG